MSCATNPEFALEEMCFTSMVRENGFVNSLYKFFGVCSSLTVLAELPSNVMKHAMFLGGGSPWKSSEKWNCLRSACLPTQSGEKGELQIRLLPFC